MQNFRAEPDASHEFSTAANLQKAAAVQTVRIQSAFAHHQFDLSQKPTYVRISIAMGEITLSPLLFQAESGDVGDRRT